jgi:hypothetical protein
MAGADPGGRDWSSAYDEAAKATADGMTDATYACYKIATMLQQSGFNHGQAEQASDQTLFTTPADTTTYQAPARLSCDPDPPSAAGGSSDPPKGWGLIEHAVGYVWPNGDPDKLRRAAHAWDAAADRLNTTSYEIPEALHAIRSQQSPEVEDAVTVCEAVMGHLQDIASSCRDLSTACIQLADHIEHAHKEVIDELTELLAWTVAIQAGGAALAFFSFGGSAAAAQAAQAVRIAATALRVGTVIPKLAAAARAVAAGITKVTTTIAGVSKRLKIFRSARTGKPATKDATALTQAAGAPGHALRSVDDVFANPQLLSGRTPGEFEAILKGTPGFSVTTMRPVKPLAHNCVGTPVEVTTAPSLTGES